MFEKISKKTTYKNNVEKVIIFKYRKQGTKKEFFAPELENGKRLNSTMYSKMYDAEKLAKLYLNR